MSKDHPPKFFNGNEFIDLLTDKTAMPAGKGHQLVEPRPHNIDLDLIRSQLQDIQRSQMKVVD